MSARVKSSSRISKPGPSKSRDSLKKSNAAGYAKRLSKKSSHKTPSFDDVYEYAPSAVRRAKIGLELDREEVLDRGHASDDEIDLAGMGQEGREGIRARLLGENEDDEQLDSGDDEELESDDAFDESDEETYAGFDFSRKRTKAGPSRKKDTRKSHKNVPEVNLNEDSDDIVSDVDSADKLQEDEDDEMEDGDADNFFDVLEVFDGKADDDAPTMQAKEKIKTPVSGVFDEAIESEEDEMSEDEQDEEEAISLSDHEASPEALAELESFLSKLDPTEGKKRKLDDASVAQSLLKKRRLRQERTEAGAEGEFGVSAGGSSALKLDDLLAPLASSSALTALTKSTKVLTSTSSKTKTLSAPLPQRAQERLDREAAYEQTKEEVDKWSATMKLIKQAEHLSFPLQAQSQARTSNLELAAKFKPSNELESAVDKLLKSAQLRDQDIPGTEALKMAHLSVEEVEARRAELRIMRELAFRADKKAKRIAKIKSKTYRRIRKKQKERLGENDGDEDDGEDDAARLKAETERARERATLRHKTTGKWAKALQGREGLDIDQRQAIGEMLERGEKLRRRIQGEMSGDDSEGSKSDDEEQDTEGIKQGAFEELAALNASASAPSVDLKSKSVFNMKFMRDAAARQMREADTEADDFIKEMGRELGSDADDDALDEGTLAEGPSVQRVGGRVSYHPGSIIDAISAKPLGSGASETSSVTLQSADLMQDVSQTLDPISSPTISVAAEESNPWLIASSSSSGPSRKRSEVVVQKGSDAVAKSSNKLKKQAAKGELEQDRARDDAVLEIDANKILTVLEPPVLDAERKPKAKKKRKYVKVPVQLPTAGVDGDGDESDGHSEVDEQERTLEEKRQGGKGKGVAAFEQRELVSLAFSGDNVVQAFEDLKQKEIEEDAPREVDTTLPGWGSWGGTGAKKLPPRPNLIKKIAGVDPSSRADYKKAHVIISERRDKKAAKYLVKELPFPYTSHAQYGRSMGMPIGTEWNTRVGFQRGTLPRVVKKMGTVIEPLEKQW